jgi:hypothetical protein
MQQSVETQSPVGEQQRESAAGQAAQQGKQRSSAIEGCPHAAYVQMRHALGHEVEGRRSTAIKNIELLHMAAQARGAQLRHGRGGQMLAVAASGCMLTTAACQLLHTRISADSSFSVQKAKMLSSACAYSMLAAAGQCVW